MRPITGFSTDHGVIEGLDGIMIPIMENQMEKDMEDGM